MKPTPFRGFRRKGVAVALDLRTHPTQIAIANYSQTEVAVRFALKTLTYGTMHLTVAVTVAYALTRDWRVALAVGLIEPVVQTAAFAIHERAWARLDRKRQALVSSEPPAAASAAA